MTTCVVPLATLVGTKSTIVWTETVVHAEKVTETVVQAEKVTETVVHAEKVTETVVHAEKVTP